MYSLLSVKLYKLCYMSLGCKNIFRCWFWLAVQQTRLVLENLLSYAFVSLNFFVNRLFKPYYLMLFIDITFMILRFLPFHLSSAYLPNCFGCDCQHEFVFCLFWLSLNLLKQFLCIFYVHSIIFALPNKNQNTIHGS